MIGYFIIIDKQDDSNFMNCDIYSSTNLIARETCIDKYKLMNIIEDIASDNVVILKDTEYLKNINTNRLYDYTCIVIKHNSNTGYRVLFNPSTKNNCCKPIELIDTSIDRILQYIEKMKLYI